MQSLRKLAVRRCGKQIWSCLPLVNVADSSCVTPRVFSTSCQRDGDKKLFTPGPLGTSMTVKQAMLRDLGSRDIEFINCVKKLRSCLLQIADVSEEKFTCIPMQGSGTFAVESVFQTSVPRKGGRVLLLENGVYSRRMKQLCDVLSIPTRVESFPEDCSVNAKHVESILKADRAFTHIGIVHCETSSGIMNQVEEVGAVVKKYIPDCTYFVDAMSSFGAVPLDMNGGKVDVMVSSANKCLQGVPGFSFIVMSKEKLAECQGNSRSVSLDLYDQCTSLDKTGQFRFTPATHSMLAFVQALDEFYKEGGVQGRGQRYKTMCTLLKDGMAKLGFKEYLDVDVAGYIITCFFYPKHPNFDFTEFYNRLNDKGDVIYPGRLLKADCFRIGTIGHLYPDDVKRLLTNIEAVCKEMSIPVPVPN